MTTVIKCQLCGQFFNVSKTRSMKRRPRTCPQCRAQYAEILKSLHTFSTNWIMWKGCATIIRLAYISAPTNAQACSLVKKDCYAVSTALINDKVPTLRNIDPCTLCEHGRSRQGV